jgi:hypothetical protein
MTRPRPWAGSAELEVSGDMTKRAMPDPQELLYLQVSKTEAWEFPQRPLREWSSIAKLVSHARLIA